MRDVSRQQGGLLCGSNARSSPIIYVLGEEVIMMLGKVEHRTQKEAVSYPRKSDTSNAPLLKPKILYFIKLFS